MAGRKYGPVPKKNVGRARRLRRQQTDAERCLWHRLRARRLGGHKFRRQHTLDEYIVDFYCDDARLVIEVDGGGHNEPHQKGYDQQRTLTLEELGLRVLRFWNDEVLLHTEQVLEVILAAVENVPSPCPSPAGRGDS
jgi:very-short-patch-repair endonuclease